MKKSACIKVLVTDELNRNFPGIKRNTYTLKLSRRFNIFSSFLKTIPKTKSLNSAKIIFANLAWNILGKLLPRASLITWKDSQIGELDARLYYPKNKNTSATILYFHGGGYCLGSINTHHSFLTYLSKTCNSQVLAINYRLAPKNPYPAALHDAIESYKWLLPSANEPIWIAGDSAGGGLALALLLAIKNQGLKMPQGVFLFSPWLDLAPCYHGKKDQQLYDDVLHQDAVFKAARLYAGNHDLHSPLVSPLKGNLKGLPPILIQVSKDELIYEESLTLFTAIQNVGGRAVLQIWTKMFHSWPYFAGFLPESRKAITHLAVLLQQLNEDPSR